MPNSQHLTLQDLRIIIHGLKMATLYFVEDTVISEITSMIKGLPNAEELDGLRQEPGAIKNLEKDIGKILRLIEVYGKRDNEYKIRYKIHKDLPPRYQVLDWRLPMKQVANKLVIELIRLSESLDNIRESEISERLIKCAKNVREAEVPEADLIKITSDILNRFGLAEEVGLIKKAIAEYDVGAEEIRGGLGQINQMIDEMLSGIREKWTYLKKSPDSENVLEQLGNIWRSLTGLKPYISQADKDTIQADQYLQQMVPQAFTWKDGSEQLKPQWITVTNPNHPDKGWDVAVVNKDNKNYLVQEDESTGQITYKEVDMTELTENKPLISAVPEPDKDVVAVAPEASMDVAPEVVRQEEVVPGATETVEEEEVVPGAVETSVPSVSLLRQNYPKEAGKYDALDLKALNQEIYARQHDSVRLQKQKGTKFQNDAKYHKDMYNLAREIYLEKMAQEPLEPSEEMVAAFNLSKYLKIS